MFNDFLKEAQALQDTMETYAIAMVVRRVEPTSGKPGDKAIIRKDGSISGWIGGGCTRGIVLKEAFAAMQDGKPRLVSIDNEGNAITKPGVMKYNMTCQSGGAVDVYIEPVLPKPHVLIMGKSHIAMALCKLGKTMGYTISLVTDTGDKDGFADADHLILQADFDSTKVKENTYIVVSTQGEGDENALESAVRSKAAYVAFVASRKKANSLFRELKNRGISFDQLKEIRTPAGLDIKAKLPEEVAISILAQIIEHIRGGKAITNTEKVEEKKQGSMMPEDYYINPVCQVPVYKAGAKHMVEYKNEKVYFCCDGCKVSFDKEPEKYMVAK